MSRHVTTLPDGTLAIIHVAEGTAAQEARWLEKTLFEINRIASGIDPSVHFDDYRAPRPWTARLINLEDIPTDRSRRHAWRERTVGGKPEIFDDTRIPDKL